MPIALETLARKTGRLEKVFLLGLVVYGALRWLAPAASLTALVALALYLVGLVVLFRLVRGGIGRMIWRLRNRLIIAYLFIAVVPIGLILALAGLSTYWITGQIAGYIINSELKRRTASLRPAAEALAQSPPGQRLALVERLAPFTGTLAPRVVIRDSSEHRFPPESDLSAPPPGWKDATGIVLRGGRLYCWAHAVSADADVTVASPLTHEFLAGLASGLGSVSLVTAPEGSVPSSPGPRLTLDGKNIRLDEADSKSPRRDRVPPPYNQADVAVSGYYPVSIMIWDRPGETENAGILVRTRVSAVLGLVFGHSVVAADFEWGQLVWWAFLVICGLFLLVELVSLVIGVSITRTVTNAVHELYEGTERVKEGDFSHRIPVRGNNQLAELGGSFNTMTANLERLIVVAKEKERLQSELEIAREVQSQLFPKSAPDMKHLRITGICNPARMVSGDYYDFMSLANSNLAFAIGDVAGKGISAALLMAAIQSAMRTQLTLGVPAAAAAGSGTSYPQYSTAHLVGQLNKQLYANTSAEKYATFYFALYDDRTQTLTYTNAGHLPPILIRDGRAEELEVTGTVVGAFPFAQYDEKQVELRIGDLLVAYTDGITEPENEYGEMFGDQRLKDLLLKHSAEDGGEIIARVMEAVEEWSGGGELQDDMTMLVARRI